MRRHCTWKLFQGLFHCSQTGLIRRRIFMNFGGFGDTSVVLFGFGGTGPSPSGESNLSSGACVSVLFWRCSGSCESRPSPVPCFLCVCVCAPLGPSPCCSPDCPNRTRLCLCCEQLLSGNPSVCGAGTYLRGSGGHGGHDQSCTSSSLPVSSRHIWGLDPASECVDLHVF